MHTTEQAAELDQLGGPASTAGKPWPGGGGDLEETIPGERPLQTREGSDKQPSVEREEKGEWRERSLRIKQLEGAIISLSMGGNGEERIN